MACKITGKTQFHQHSKYEEKGYINLKRFSRSLLLSWNDY